MIITLSARDPAQKFALAAVAVAAFLACWSGEAFTAEMPKELIGSWCATDVQTKYKQCREPGDFTIRRTFIDQEDYNCKLLGVSERSNGVWIVKERCKHIEGSPRTLTTTRYSRRGVYLHVEITNDQNDPNN